jgi:hypothetical protein
MVPIAPDAVKRAGFAHEVLIDNVNCQMNAPHN